MDKAVERLSTEDETVGCTIEVEPSVLTDNVLTNGLTEMLV